MISKDQADKKADDKYKVYRIKQDKEYKSDFDNLIEGSKKVKRK